ncbi:MAG: FeoA family protein [Flavobacteriaceae bacterium]|nr:ferrous iron transport protein A [Flavobacteriaceae bacterium]MDG1968768.1 FeoA family protein [Flavobacteriaceae bacterium]
MMISLDQLAIGQKAIIESIETDVLPLKLIEMGCLPGNEVSLLYLAPFRDPLYLKVDEAHLAIRKEVARCIMVKPFGDD